MNDCKNDRRGFIKLSGQLGLAGLLGCASFRANARLLPAGLKFGHITDTHFSVSEDPRRSGRPYHGWLYGNARELADDIVQRMIDHQAGPPSLIVHGGDLTSSGPRSRAQERLRAAEEWLSRRPVPVRLTRGRRETGAGNVSAKTFLAQMSLFGFFDGEGFYSYNHDGIHFIHLDTSGGLSAQGAEAMLRGRKQQLAWLLADLSESPDAPAVISMHASLMETGSDTIGALCERDRRELFRIIRAHPRVVLVLCGRSLENRGRMIPGANALCLSTSSCMTYPCGGRMVELEVGPDGDVQIKSWFVQTRLLDLVEKSFHLGMNSAIQRVGAREDRTLDADLKKRMVSRLVAPEASPSVWWPGRESLTLAVVSDTHIASDSLVSDEMKSINKLIGHYNEKGSRALLTDVLDQIGSGRHRVEFYDDVFQNDPKAPGHFLDLDVDALLITGDLTEHGVREEAEPVASMLSGLPPLLRDKTRVAIGNHDMYGQEFAPHGSASGREVISRIFSGFGPENGRAHYTVHLTDWLSLVVMDTVIATHDNMGLIQDQVDWIEDRLEELSDRAVILAAHHAAYPLFLEPIGMHAYSRLEFNFTPFVSATRLLLQDLAARHPNLKMFLSGHFHGTAVDQHPRPGARGDAPDDRCVTHVQVPCTIEYPCGYRLFKIERAGSRCRIEYTNAYNRLCDLRRESSRALVYRAFGKSIRPPKNFEKALAYLMGQDNPQGRIEVMNAFDLTDFNIRGFKDGTANRGLGNSGKPNIRGVIEFTI